MAGRADPRTAAAPAFVACCGRSGSTLLRFLIDAHPGIACPGETDLAVVASGYARIATDLAGGDAGAARLATRTMAEGLMASLLERSGKARWCDKSLSNVFHLELLADLWPEARFVLLHRHCMDFIHNGLEVSPWGLAEYGFAQVAEKSPTDSVVALAAYWLDRTSRLVAFEDRHPERCLRLRYEDLVTDTQPTVERLLGFLGLDAVDDLAERAFASDHSTYGAADHEIWYSTAITAASLGVGATVPPGHVAGPLRAGVNSLLERLGYQPVDDSWGSGGSAAGGDREPSGRLAELRVVDRHAVLASGVADLLQGSWTPLPSSALRGPSFVVAVEERDFEALADGTLNLGGALRSRTVRSYGPLPHALRDEREVFLALRRVAADHAAGIRSLLRGAARPSPATGVTRAR